MKENEIEAYNKIASGIVSAIYASLKAAVEQGTELESIIFSDKIPEMCGNPKIVYKVECRNGENVVVGGEMTFAQKLSGSVLIVSEKEISLCGEDGWNGAVWNFHYPHEEWTEEEKLMLDALVAFFARCYEKRM